MSSGERECPPVPRENLKRAHLPDILFVVVQDVGKHGACVAQQRQGNVHFDLLDPEIHVGIEQPRLFGRPEKPLNLSPCVVVFLPPGICPAK